MKLSSDGGFLYSLTRKKNREFFRKEGVIDMKIRTKNDLSAFQAAVDECKSSVWLMSAKGEQYDMKKDSECMRGLARILADDRDELEIYTSNFHDESIMTDFWLKHCA